MKILKLLFVLVLIYSGCSSSDYDYKKDKLIGEWERYGDEFAGVIVTVEYNEETGLLEGRLGLVIPPAMDSFDFRPLDIKWLDIEKISNNKYILRDMIRTDYVIRNNKKEYFISIIIDMSQEEIDKLPDYLPFYKHASLHFINEDTVCITRKNDNVSSRGLKQYWRRIK